MMLQIYERLGIFDFNCLNNQNCPSSKQSRLLVVEGFVVCNSILSSLKIIKLIQCSLIPKRELYGWWFYVSVRNEKNFTQTSGRKRLTN